MPPDRAAFIKARGEAPPLAMAAIKSETGAMTTAISAQEAIKLISDERGSRGLCVVRFTGRFLAARLAAPLVGGPRHLQQMPLADDETQHHTYQRPIVRAPAAVQKRSTGGRQEH